MPIRRSPLALCLLLGTSPLAAQGPEAVEVIAAYARLSTRPLWPGFDPATTPVAVFDGDSTWLSSHPAPGARYAPTGRPGIWVMAGRDPAVNANSSAQLDSAITATLLLDRHRPGSATRWAATLIHEAFHVFQRAHHADWTANEAEFFTYPVESEAAQRLQRMETEQWRRAVALQDPGCWARSALHTRELRFALLPVGAVEYERGTELNEGLATYVEFRAASLDTIPFPVAGFGPDGARLRAYTIGPAMGQLLDGFAPKWREALERGPTRSLDQLLRGAVPAGARCRLTAAEEDSIRRLAHDDVQTIQVTHEALRDSVQDAPGWRVEIVADSGVPLWPQRFDPWNVVALKDGGIVHRRFLRLSKDGLSAEVIDRLALTEPAGSHPLFNGVRDLLITGIPEEPAVVDQPGHLLLTAPGLRIEGRTRRVERAGQAIRIFAGP